LGLSIVECGWRLRACWVFVPRATAANAATAPQGMCTASQSGHNKVSSVYVAARSGMLRVDNEVSSFYGTQARGVRQLGDVSGDASRPVAGHQLGGRAGGPAPSQNRRVGAQKDAGFRKTASSPLAWCRRCFWGSPLACDPSQRKCAPATVDESLLARTIQAKDDAGWVARVVWGGVGWGFQR
jgi:hypothetical protein